MRIFLAAFIALLAVFTAPAAAAPTEMTDPCGDAFVYAAVNGESVSSPDPISPNFDVKSAALATVRAGDTAPVLGIDFTLQVCGEVVEPGQSQSYGWHWLTEAGCRVRLVLSRAQNVDVPSGVSDPLSVTFTETCDAEEQSLPLGTEVEDTFVVGLDPAEVVTMDGDRLTVALRTADLPAEALPGVAEGARFVQPRAMAQMAHGPTAVFFSDAEHSAYVTGGRDSAGGADFVVGQ